MNITQGLSRAARLRPDANAITFESRRTTYRELADRVSRIAAGLLKLGMNAGDRVAVLMLNSDLYLELYLAVAWAGAVIVPLNTRWTTQENLDAVSDSGASMLFVDGAFLQAGQSIAGALSGLALAFAGPDETPNGLLSFEAILDLSADRFESKPSGSDLAGIFYTGGTSGRSKGVMLSHANLVASAYSALAEGLYSESSVFLHVAPMFHLANGSAMYPLLLSGGRHVIVKAFSPGGVCEAIRTHAVTEMLLVPTMIQTLVDDPGTASFDLSSLRSLIYGASPFSEALLDRVHAMLPKLDLYQCYGMTELSPIATILRPEQHVCEGRARNRHKSVGRPAIGCDVQVVDQQGRKQADGKIGEVVVRGDTVMMGYWRRPEETAKAVVNGWMRTGDAGYMEADGYLHLVDRLKDMIISGGENVYSVEVENTLAQHATVAQCAVIGIPSEKWGEQVHAVVALREGMNVSSDELIEFCKARMAGYKCPRTIEIRSEPFPLSGAGKIVKNELRKPFWEAKSRMVS